MVGERVISGGWVAFSQIASKLINLAVFFVLALYLDVYDYGIVAWAWIFVSVGEVLFDLGVSQAFIRDRELSEAAVSTTYWILIILGLFWTFFVAGAAYVLMLISADSVVIEVLFALSPLFIVRAVVAMHVAFLTSISEFILIAKAEISGAILSAAVAVSMAWGGFGVWSLVIRPLVLALTVVVVIMAFKPVLPTFCFKRSIAQRLFRFGIPVMLSNNIAPLIEQVGERIIIGAAFGTYGLGLAEFARRPVLVASQAIAGILRGFVFKNLVDARAKGLREMRKDRRTFITVFSFIGLVAFGVIFSFSIYGVPAVWGGVWDESIPIMAAYSPAILFVTVRGVVVYSIIAQGYSKQLVSLSFGSALMVLAALLVGSQIGLSGIGVAYSGAILISLAMFVVYDASRMGRSI